MNYISIYVKKTSGNSSFIKFLTIYYKVFSYLCNIVFFPIVDFNSDKFSLSFRTYFAPSDSIVSISNLLLSEKNFTHYMLVDILYDFNIYSRLWLFKNFPTYKSLILFFFKNFFFKLNFINSSSILYSFDVYFTFFNFSLNGLVCNNDIVLF